MAARCLPQYRRRAVLPPDNNAHAACLPVAARRLRHACRVYLPSPLFYAATDARLFGHAGLRLRHACFTCYSSMPAACATYAR